MSGFDITGLQHALGTTNMGFVPAWIIAIILCIVIAIMINKGVGDKHKTAMSLAPITCLMITLGFNMNIVFILISFIAFGIYAFMGEGLKEHTIETDD